MFRCSQEEGVCISVLSSEIGCMNLEVFNTKLLLNQDVFIKDRMIGCVFFLIGDCTPE